MGIALFNKGCQSWDDDASTAVQQLIGHDPEVVKQLFDLTVAPPEPAASGLALIEGLEITDLQIHPEANPQVRRVTFGLRASAGPGLRTGGITVAHPRITARMTVWVQRGTQRSRMFLVPGPYRRDSGRDWQSTASDCSTARCRHRRSSRSRT